MIKTKTPRPRRMARVSDAASEREARPPSKLDRLEALLLAEPGASLAEMMAATGWQPHSVRGAMAGALKKRGLTIGSEKIDGMRRYRAVRA